MKRSKIMKATKFLRLLLLSSFVLVGCDKPFSKKETEPTTNDTPATPGDEGAPEGEPAKPTKKTITYKMEKLLKGSSSSYYNVDVDYDNAYFLRDAEVYDKDLSLLSFGGAISATYKTWILDFFDDTEFENITTHDYDQEPTADTLGYALAHKSIGEYELFAVAIRGHEYKKEWENNLKIGAEGDHQGYLARGNELYSALSTYINQYKGEKSIKLWSFGYSRAGALADMLASLILRSDGINVNPKNMFIYTFEAPNSLTEEHAIAYDNIHNIINSADLVTYIPPNKYGLYRPGKDFEIYDANVSSIVREFDPTLSIPAYISCKPDGSTQCNNDVDFVNYILDSIFDYHLDDDKDAQTREDYVEHYQEGLSYIVGLLFSMSASNRSAMISSLSDYSVILPIMLDSTGASLANHIKTYLNNDHIEYDNDQLVAACKTLQDGFSTIFAGLVSVMMNNNYKSNFTRTINMHYPEVTYCLLNNAHSKLEA